MVIRTQCESVTQAYKGRRKGSPWGPEEGLKEVGGGAPILTRQEGPAASRGMSECGAPGRSDDSNVLSPPESHREGCLYHTGQNRKGGTFYKAAVPTGGGGHPGVSLASGRVQVRARTGTPGVHQPSRHVLQRTWLHTCVTCGFPADTVLLNPRCQAGGEHGTEMRFCRVKQTTATDCPQGWSLRGP